MNRPDSPFYLRFANGPSSSSSCPFQSAYDYLHRRVRRQPRLLALDAEVHGNTAIQLFAAEMSIYENAILCHETPPEKPTAPAPKRKKVTLRHVSFSPLGASKVRQATTTQPSPTPVLARPAAKSWPAHQELTRHGCTKST